MNHCNYELIFNNTNDNNDNNNNNINIVCVHSLMRNENLNFENKLLSVHYITVIATTIVII